MYTPTQSSFGTFGRNEDKGDMTNGMFFQMDSRCKIRTIGNIQWEPVPF